MSAPQLSEPFALHGGMYQVRVHNGMVALEKVSHDGRVHPIATLASLAVEATVAPQLAHAVKSAQTSIPRRF